MPGPAARAVQRDEVYAGLGRDAEYGSDIPGIEGPGLEADAFGSALA
jgi:hypothetical protein